MSVELRTKCDACHEILDKDEEGFRMYALRFKSGNPAPSKREKGEEGIDLCQECWKKVMAQVAEQHPS